MIEGFSELGDSTEFYAHQQEQFRVRNIAMAESNDTVTESLNRLNLANKNIVQHDDRRMNQINKVMKADRDKVKAEKEGLKETGEALKNFTAEGAKRSKKMFRLNQAVLIGEAIMNTYAGATKALATLPPPFNFAVAGLTVATGLAQVANIR